MILACGILNSAAQPNGGFENWSNQYNYETPVSWQTLNFLSTAFPPNPLSAFKAIGIDKHSGNYALKLKTVFLTNNPAPDKIDDTIGLTFTGKVNLFPPSYKYGFPYNGRPEKFEFWAKYFPLGNDTAGVRVTLQNWNGAKNDTIAFGELNLAATSQYTLFQLNLTYYSNDLPDSASIIFGSSKNKYRARVGSTLFIDDAAFSGWVGIGENNPFTDKVKIFPNPARDNVNILAQIENADNVQIIDASGKLAGVYKILNNHSDVNTNLFAEGIYFYEIRDKQERALAKGKFNIVK